MKKQLSVGSVVAVLAAAAMLTSAVAQTVVYDNSAPASRLNKWTGGSTYNREFGDEINMSLANANPSNLNDWRLSTFQFEYYSAVADVANKSWRLRLYPVSGSAPASTPIFDSNDLVGQSTAIVNGYNTATVTMDVPVSSPKLVWTVSFGGSYQAGDAVGLALYDPVKTGSSLSDYWENVGGTWSTYVISGGTVPANFAAKITAIPEPSTIALGAIGALALLGLRRVRRS